MRRIYWYLFSGIIFFLLSACTGSRGLLSEAASGVRTVQQDVSLPFSSDQLKSTAQSQSSLTPLSSQDQADSSAALAEAEVSLKRLQESVTRRQADLTSKPGWLKRQILLTILVDGQERTIEDESLIQFDEYGVVIQVIKARGNARCACQGGQVLAWTRNGEARTVWQMQPEEIFAVIKGPAGIDEPLTHITGLEPGQPINLDFNFSDYARGRLAEGAQLQHQALYEDGTYLGELYNLWDGSRRIEALFDLETGKLERLQVFNQSGGEASLLWRIDLAMEQEVESEQ